MSTVSPASEASEITRSLRLNYPMALVREPILTRLIRRFDLTVSILGAQIGLDEGWVELTASGTASELEQAVGWLVSEGLRVTFLD